MKASPTDRDDIVAAFIDGVSWRSQSDAVKTINPSNGQMICSIPAGSAADVDRAVAVARHAFEDGRWSSAAPSFRKAALLRFGDLIAAEAPSLDALDAGDMGKPIRETFGNAATAAHLMRFYAEGADKITGDTYVSDKNSFVVQRLVPRGVIAAVVPWNFPTCVAALKAAPALATGNSVVLKPSELSSRSAVRLAELAMQAGVPSGVFNVVPGLGETVGRALGLHMDIDMLTFTGSTEVGKRMVQYSGQSNLKVIMAECGGKSPQIVFDDGIDVDAVADSIARSLLANQGQICSVGTRLLVQRSIESKLLDAISARFQRVVIGDALDSATTFGPMASARQCSRVMEYIEAAPADGAELMVGGRRANRESNGFFVEPTIFRRVPSTARIAREEIFGPVLAASIFDEETEAIRISNDTSYGLAAYAWTAQISRGMRLMKAIRAPIQINAAAPSGEGAGFMPCYEPARQSGIGAEGGLTGMTSYLRRQRVVFNHS